MSSEIEIKKVENGFIVKYTVERSETIQPIHTFTEPEKFVAKTLDDAIRIVKEKFGESTEKEESMETKGMKNF